MKRKRHTIIVSNLIQSGKKVPTYLADPEKSTKLPFYLLDLPFTSAYFSNYLCI